MSKKTAQKYLKALGYYKGAIDGVFGTMSRNAIKHFQRDNKLTADGICGKKTIAKLKSVYAKKKAKEKIKEVSKAIFSWQNKDGSINWKEVEKLGFKKSEFKCHCGEKYCKGYPAEISIYLLNALINIRKKFGGNVLITSPLRCPTWNKKQGGVTGSYHTKGKAADIIVYDKNGKIVPQSKVKAYAKKQKHFHYSYYGTKSMGKATHIDFSK